MGEREAPYQELTGVTLPSEAMQEFLGKRRPPTPVATGAIDPQERLIGSPAITP
jgi:hypothetical protein